MIRRPSLTNVSFIALGWIVLASASWSRPTEPPHIGTETRVAGKERRDGKQILKNAVRAIGPIDRFDAVKSIRFAGASSSLSEEGSQAATTDMLFYFPPDLDGLWMYSSFRKEDTSHHTRTLAGDSAWMQGSMILPAELYRDAVRYASTKLLTILRYREHPQAQIAWQGETEVAGEAADLVAVTLYGFTSVLEVEQASSRVLAVRFPSSEIQEGASHQVVRRSYFDYRQVGELQVPFRQEVTVDGKPFTRWQLEAVELDVDLDPVLFVLPTQVGSEN